MGDHTFRWRDGSSIDIRVLKEGTLKTEAFTGDNHDIMWRATVKRVDNVNLHRIKINYVPPSHEFERARSAHEGLSEKASNMALNRPPVKQIFRRAERHSFKRYSLSNVLDLCMWWAFGEARDCELEEERHQLYEKVIKRRRMLENGF